MSLCACHNIATFTTLQCTNTFKHFGTQHLGVLVLQVTTCRGPRFYFSYIYNFYAPGILIETFLCFFILLSRSSFVVFLFIQSVGLCFEKILLNTHLRRRRLIITFLYLIFSSNTEVTGSSENHYLDITVKYIFHYALPINNT